MSEEKAASSAGRLPRRFTIACPRCKVEVELSLDWTPVLTQTYAYEAWLTAKVAASSTSHRCEVPGG